MLSYHQLRRILNLTAAKKSERKPTSTKKVDKAAHDDTRASSGHYVSLMAQYAAEHRGDIAKINALLTRCLNHADNLLDDEKRVHIVVGCAEALARTKARILDIEMQHERNKLQLENTRVLREPVRITFDVGIKPMRDADVAAKGRTKARTKARDNK